MSFSSDMASACCHVGTQNSSSAPRVPAWAVEPDSEPRFARVLAAVSFTDAFARACSRRAAIVNASVATACRLFDGWNAILTASSRLACGSVLGSYITG